MQYQELIFVCLLAKSHFIVEMLEKTAKDNLKGIYDFVEQ